MQLETERLLLRRPQDGDLDAYAELFADPGVARYTGGVTKSRAESQRTLERMIRHWDDHGIGLFSAVREEDDQVLGRVGFLVWDAESWRHAMLRPPRGKTETEIGWTLGRAYWGRGYATEAATAVRDWALRELGLPRLISLSSAATTRQSAWPGSSARRSSAKVCPVLFPRRPTSTR